MGEALVNRSTGTDFGNMTFSGGLAATRDGNTNQDDAAAARTIGSAATGYAGSAFGAGKAYSRFIIYGTNNAGYHDSGTGTIILTIYGKNGVPANSTDGTSLGTTSFANYANASDGKNIASTNLVTTYTHVWVAVTLPSADVSRCAEFIIYEVTASAPPPRRRGPRFFRRSS